jgi:AcrR family transcriptional regulator
VTGVVGVPRGAEAVQASLITAASVLFAARGPSRTSVREVSAAANVNHGLVHHYFGSKDGLLRAVLDELAGHAADEIVDWDGVTVFEESSATSRHSRIVAHLLLESRNPADVQTSFPTIERLTADLRGRGMSPDEAAQRASLVGALVLGWQLFAPFLERAAGVESGAGDALGAGIRRLLAPE